MAPRSFWKGYLKLSLVTCPVAMVPATSDNEKVKFHTVNRKTGNRVQSQYVDAVTGDPVDDEDELKGYAIKEDDYVLLEDDELESVSLESTRTIDIDCFVPTDSIEWIWYDKPHYLTPNDAVGEEAFAVIRDAMIASKTAGIARLVMYRRERAVLLKPCDKGIILWTLRFGDEVRDPDIYFETVKSDKPDPKLMGLMKQLVEEKTKPWSPELAHDPIQDQILEVIALKKKKTKRPTKTSQTSPTEKPTNVVNIMDALKKSISSEKKNS